MIEAPEALYLAGQLNRTVKGKTITSVFAQYTPHKFAWFHGQPEEYADRMTGKTIGPTRAQGGMDMLYNARIHPKRKIGTLSNQQKEELYERVKETMHEIYRSGGRCTETDLFGVSGKYVPHLSKDTAGHECPRCGETIVKENFLGGSIYYCKGCQPI